MASNTALAELIGLQYNVRVKFHAFRTIPWVEWFVAQILGYWCVLRLEELGCSTLGLGRRRKFFSCFHHQLQKPGNSCLLSHRQRARNLRGQYTQQRERRQAKNAVLQSWRTIRCSDMTMGYHR
jgi:hypothetical protein